MANAAHAGFFPSTLNGGGGTVTYVRRRGISNPSNPIACQDAVKADANGDILGLGTSSTHATAVDSVSMGASYVDSSGARVTRAQLPASTTYSGSTVDPVNASYVFVTEAADRVKYRCSISTAMTLTNLRNCFDISLAASVNGYSQQQLRGASAATTATLPFRFVEFIFAADNAVDSANAHVFAMINAGQTEPSMTAYTGL